MRNLNSPTLVDLGVRGYTTHNSPARPLYVTFSVIIDLGILLFITLFAFIKFNIPPVPHPLYLISMVIGCVAYWVIQRFIWGTTLGERAWGLKTRFRYLLYQCDYFSPSRLILSCLITSVTFVLSLYFIYEEVSHHPLWLNASSVELEPFVPPVDKGADTNWVITPYFYSLGGWPNQFDGQPILYTLPYGAGPPRHFIGSILSQWGEEKDIKLMIEGPRTPQGMSQGIGTRDAIRDCILNLHSYGCLVVREEVLKRHIEEMTPESGQRIRGKVDWSLQWFGVHSTNLPSEEATQGIHLRGVYPNEIQDRFILINDRGTHQSFILRRPRTQKGEVAYQRVEEAIRSVRMFADLDAVRSWADRELESINLDAALGSADIREVTKNFLKIQSILLSKISVDPNIFDAYFHLAGASLLFMKKVTPHMDSSDRGSPNLDSSHLGSPSDLGPNQVRVQSIIEAAITNIDSAYRYAKLVSVKLGANHGHSDGGVGNGGAESQRMHQLYQMWIESRKWK